MSQHACSAGAEVLTHKVICLDSSVLSKVVFNLPAIHLCGESRRELSGKISHWMVVWIKNHLALVHHHSEWLSFVLVWSRVKLEKNWGSIISGPAEINVFGEARGQIVGFLAVSTSTNYLY